MKIQDRRNEEGPGLLFDQLEQGGVVEGTDTGYIYYVAFDPGFEPPKRLVNFTKKVVQNPRYCAGRYRRIHDASLVLPPEHK